MLAFLISPVTWAIALGGAYIGAQIDDKVDSTSHPSDTIGNSLNMNTVIFYGGAAALAYFLWKRVLK